MTEELTPAELRRLHAENERLRAALRDAICQAPGRDQWHAATDAALKEQQ